MVKDSSREGGRYVTILNRWADRQKASQSGGYLSEDLKEVIGADIQEKSTPDKGE